MIELKGSYPANSENQRAQGPRRVTQTQRKTTPFAPRLDGPEHEAGEAVERDGNADETTLEG